MENYSDSELNEQLSALKKSLKENSSKENASCVPSHQDVEPTSINFCDNWAVLMPLSLKYEAYVEPLAWERSNKKYRAKYMSMDKEGRMARYGIKYMSDDDDPARALVMTLIKILKSTEEYSMAVSLQRFNEWKKKGKSQGAKYMISICDTFDHDDYPVYVMPEENLEEKKREFDGVNMQRINEVVTL